MKFTRWPTAPPKAPSITNPKGSEAHTISGIWWLMCGMASAVYLIVGGFIVVAAFRGRRTEGGKSAAQLAVTRSSDSRR